MRWALCSLSLAPISRGLQQGRKACWILLTLACLSLLGSAATADEAAEAKQKRGLELFSGGVRAALVQHCGKCHTGEHVEGEFDLGQREGLLEGGSSGVAVIPGNAKDSLLFKLISHQKTPHMPEKGEKLPEELIAKIGAWIDLDAPYDKPLVDTAGIPAWTKKRVAEDAREFWSYQRLKRVEPPTVGDPRWNQTTIDRFLRVTQEAAGVQPNPPASRAQLIRRMYFDLLGLPPSPAEIAEFVNDTAPDATSRLIDRLLANPHYGERGARHWLDLARFAESHGYEHDTDRPTAYHYRDFVIQALNQDLPYNTFVKWQLAGDEYEPENNLALMATGFLAAGVHSTQITKNEVEKHRYDEMDDMLATVGTSMLGLTFGCARCHDHKFDAIPQADYYRMLATFTTTVRSEVDLNFDKAGYETAKAAFNKEHAPLTEAVARFEKEVLPARLEQWEATRPAGTTAEPWLVLDSVSQTSNGGATLSKLGDGSIRATGKNPKFDTYVITARSHTPNLKGLRIEALADDGLVKRGPGRASNGNFALSDLKVTIAAADGSNPQPVKLTAPRATFEQPGLPIAAVLDDNPTSAWAVDPEFGKDHAAGFAIETPLPTDGGALWTFTLKFECNDGHNFGRVRLSLTAQPEPVDLKASGQSQILTEALGTPREKRSADQQAALLRWYRTQDAEWQKLDAAVQAHLQKEPKPILSKVLISSEGLPAVRLHTQGGDFLEQTHFLRRGDVANKDAVAAPGYLQVLMAAPEGERRWAIPPPQGWRTSYRRRDFAEWMTDVDDGAGALLARVIVNRLWQQHFGRGLVATPSDFGTRGSKPTHPELLDWLATELIAHNWQLKPLHKLMLQTAAYQQGSQTDPTRLAADSDNRWLWRHTRRRLEAEVIRDSLLACGELLDQKQFGPGTLDPASRRRSIYFTVKRSQLMPMMQVFDCPDGLSGIGERPTTTIAPQALLLMNNALARDTAHGVARRAAPTAETSPKTAVRQAYSICLGRDPAPLETADALAFIDKQSASYANIPQAESKHAALTDFCQVLMCLNEFVYVD